MLLILVVVAGVGLAIILAWTGKIGGGPSGFGGVALSVRGPADSAAVEKTQIKLSDHVPAGAERNTINDPSKTATVRFTVFNLRAFGDDGGLIKEAAISVSGPVKFQAAGNQNQRVVVTDNNGQSAFGTTEISLAPQQMTAEVKVAVEKSGFTPYHQTFLVVR